MTLSPHARAFQGLPWGEVPTTPHAWGFSIPALACPFSSFSPIPSPYYYSYLDKDFQQ
jgi:hypothetical protein